MTPQDKKELKFILKSAKEVFLFVVTVAILYTILAKIFL